jgi:hypothetical protein
METYPITYKRSGIIPYYLEYDKLILCFGIDRKSGDLSDWGGIVDYHEDIYDTACRKLYDESYKHLTINKENLLGSPYITSEKDHTIIFLVKIEPIIITNLSEWITRRKRVGKMKGVFEIYVDNIFDPKYRYYEPVKNSLYNGYKNTLLYLT